MEVKEERANDIRLAVEGRDAEMLYYFADLEEKDENEEYADSLRQLAKRIEREDVAYDEHVDNQLMDSNY